MQTSGVAHAERVADCPFSVAQRYAEDYLSGADGESKDAFMYAGPFARRVSFRFDLRDDPTEPGRAHDEVGLRWFAKSVFLPDFTGTLRMRIDGSRTRLILDGLYAPPGGAIGALFDRAIGHRIAHATAETFLRRVAAALGERHETWSAGVARGTIAD